MEKKEKKKLIVILGPNASGKSDLAIRLAKKFQGEVVSADSRQIYIGMDIGTGKVTKKEMRGIPHHLLNVVSPKRAFSVTQYRKLALRAIDSIFKRRKVPLLCGGTGFYIQAVVDGISIPVAPPNWCLRKELERKSKEKLYQVLKKIDPRRAKTIDRDNPRRVIRAIEIILRIKRAIPALEKNPLPYPVLIIGITKDKEELRKLIKERLLKRFRKGMVAEVKKLHESGVSWQKLEEFGLEYRWIARFLQKKIPFLEMREKLQKEIEHFAKRQLIWFKRDERIHWVENNRQAENLVKKFLENKS